MDAIWGSRGEGGFVRTALECRKLWKEPAGGRDGADRAQAWRCRRSPRGSAGGAPAGVGREAEAGAFRPEAAGRRGGPTRRLLVGISTVRRARREDGRRDHPAEGTGLVGGGGDALCSGRWRLCTGVHTPHHVSQWIKTSAQRRA